MPYYEHNGAKLHYEFVGSGAGADRAPVLLLHGNGESMHVFDKAIEPLLDKLPFLAIDSRAHGESTGEAAGYDTMADDAASLLRALNVECCDVVGYSDGAITALLMALDHGVSFGRMILIGANIYPEGLKLGVRLKMRGELAKCRANSDERGAKLIEIMLSEPHIDPSELAAIKSRVYVLAGDRDVIRRSHTTKIFESIPNATMIIFDRQGHDIPQRAYSRLADIMRRALK